MLSIDRTGKTSARTYFNWITFATAYCCLRPRPDLRGKNRSIRYSVNNCLLLYSQCFWITLLCFVLLFLELKKYSTSFLWRFLPTPRVFIYRSFPSCIHVCAALPAVNFIRTCFIIFFYLKEILIRATQW